MGANDLARQLAEAPERPIEERSATLGSGDQHGGGEEWYPHARILYRSAGRGL